MSGFTKPAPEDTARHYEAAHARIVALTKSLSEQQAATAVPGTPEWTVHDVLAHLTAVTTDGLAGRITGIPTDEFTAEQVRTRKDATVEELLAEWSANVPSMLEGARAGLVPPNLAVDAITHEQDMRGALRAGTVDDPEAVRFSLDLYAFGLHRKLQSQSGPSLRLVAGDSDFNVVTGGGEPDVTLRASEFERFRTLSGRRGRDAVLGLEWDGDPAAYLPFVNVFGVLPDYAVVD